MAYLQSNQIRVFPSAYRVYTGAGKFTSERNITNLIKALADKDSFVVGEVKDNRFAVVVKGYYFDWPLSFNNGKTNLRVNINIVNDYLVNVSDSSTTLDVGTNFTGLQYDTSDHSSDSNWLQVILNNELVNTGYINGLIDPKTGKWIDLTKVFNFSEGNITIKNEAINFDMDSILNTIAIASTKLVNATTLLDYNVGADTASALQPIYFKNGIPMALSKASGSATQGIYADAGVLKPMTYTLKAKVEAGGASSRLAYYANTTTVDDLATSYGSNTRNAIKLMYINTGKPADVSVSAGSATQGVYVDGGIIKPVTNSSGATVNPGTSGAIAYYDNNGQISSYGTKGTATKGIYLSSGAPTEMTYELNATVNGGSGWKNKLAYYSANNAIGRITGDYGLCPTAAISTSPAIYRSAIISGGVPKDGQRIIISTSTPPTGTSTSYANGDLWFVIDN